jgi:hypothetical protein
VSRVTFLSTEGSPLAIDASVFFHVVGCSSRGRTRQLSCHLRN